MQQPGSSAAQVLLLASKQDAVEGVRVAARDALAALPLAAGTLAGLLAPEPAIEASPGTGLSTRSRKRAKGSLGTPVAAPSSPSIPAGE